MFWNAVDCISDIWKYNQEHEFKPLWDKCNDRFKAEKSRCYKEVFRDMEYAKKEFKKVKI